MFFDGKAQKALEYSVIIMTIETILETKITNEDRLWKNTQKTKTHFLHV